MRSNRQTGLTIPLLALFMVVLIVMMALAIDLGVLYTARTSAQHAADAAALAGAFTYVTNPLASNPGASATAAALAAATQNNILGAPVPASEVTVTPNPPYVTVTISHTAPTFFAKVIGQNQAAIAVTATAQGGTGVPGQALGTSCLRPFWILRSQLGSCSSSPTPGTTLTLHNSTNPSCPPSTTPGQLSSSQWGFIDSGSGANAIQNAIYSCQNQMVTCGNSLPVETGSISAIKNMNPEPEFFGPSTGCASGSGQDCFNSVGDYSIGGPSGPISSTSQSVITVAILDDCNGEVPPPPGSTGTLNVVSFGQIFIDGISGNGNSCPPKDLQIDAHLISVNGCGSGGGGGSSGSGNTGNFAVPVRLVQTP